MVLYWNCLELRNLVEETCINYDIINQLALGRHGQTSETKTYSNLQPLHNTSLEGEFRRLEWHLGFSEWALCVGGAQAELVMRMKTVLVPDDLDRRSVRRPLMRRHHGPIVPVGAVPWAVMPKHQSMCSPQ